MSAAVLAAVNKMELNAEGREDPDDTATQDGSTALVETN